ncbi:hypothetical protein EBZ39_02855 [bacterium]|nr:hypothetical protein [bacterium]
MSNNSQLDADIVSIHDRAVAEFQRVDTLNRELLEALEELVAAVLGPNNDRKGTTPMKRAIEAIAKAKGDA